MGWQNAQFDWNQIRAFLATADEGSLSAAARSLGLTQPTLGRQVAALEETLQVTLFERTGRAMVLTEPGRQLIEHVRAMGEAAAQVALVASGQTQSVEGIVSISASDVTSYYLLPPVVEKIRKMAPGITVEIVATNSISDLKMREADIAIRHVRPAQPDLIARKLRSGKGYLYAAPAYLDRIGRPTRPEDLANAHFIGFDRSDQLGRELIARGIPVTVNPDNIRVLSESGLVYWRMVRQGLGIGVMSKEISDVDGDTEMVLPSLPPIDIPTWLTTHRELQTSKKIRLVFDVLADAFG